MKPPKVRAIYVDFRPGSEKTFSQLNRLLERHGVRLRWKRWRTSYKGKRWSPSAILVDVSGRGTYAYTRVNAEAIR